MSDENVKNCMNHYYDMYIVCRMSVVFEARWWQQCWVLMTDPSAQLTVWVLMTDPSAQPTVWALVTDPSAQPTELLECLWFLKLGGGSNEKIKINCQK
jgi:hypothetical protein